MKNYYKIFFLFILVGVLCFNFSCNGISLAYNVDYYANGKLIYTDEALENSKYKIGYNDDLSECLFDINGVSYKYGEKINVNGHVDINFYTSSEYFRIQDHGTLNVFDYFGTKRIVVIPESYNGKKVTELGNYLFEGNNTIETIYLPKNLNNLGFGVFNGCSKLNNIIVDSNNSTYDSRNNCNAVIETESNILVAGCNSSTIPEGITEISDEAFKGLANLTEINLPSSLTTIGYDAFEDCTGLTSLVIPEGVTTISWLAFGGCTGLKNLTLSSTVESIEDEAFKDCVSLTKLYIPENVSYIESGAFKGCSNLEVIKVAEENETYDSRENCNAIIETFSDTLITGCNNTVIPESIVSINDYAFYKCEGLEEVALNDNIYYIGEAAFYGCSSLKDIHIPTSLETIESDVFKYCYNLKNIVLPSNITSVDGKHSLIVLDLKLLFYQVI